MTQTIRMEGVQKAFQGPPVLRNVEWTVPAGSVSGLIGPNGAGKTTLLRIALGLLRPDGGTVEVLGERLDVNDASLRERVHYVASDRLSWPPLRVEEWFHYSSLAYPRWDGGRARQFIEALGVAPSQSLSALSSGQRTSLQIAVAVASRPDLLLFDEPTNGLDVVVKRQMLQLVIDMVAAEGATLVMATHHPEDVERMADHLAVLYDGHVVVQGGVDDMKQRMHRLQVVMPGKWPDNLAVGESIVGVERHAHAAVLTVAGSIDPVVARCHEAGALLVEPIDVDLTEMFRMVLDREGYARAQLRW